MSYTRRWAQVDNRRRRKMGSTIPGTLFMYTIQIFGWASWLERRASSTHGYTTLSFVCPRLTYVNMHTGGGFFQAVLELEGCISTWVEINRMLSWCQMAQLPSFCLQRCLLLEIDFCSVGNLVYTCVCPSLERGTRPYLLLIVRMIRQI